MAETVIVALRLPSGLVIEHEGQRRKLNGWNEGAHEMTPNREGFGFTRDVPKALFDGWYADQISAGTDLVKNNLVFAESSMERARSRADEWKPSTRSGMEGLDPKNPMPGEAHKIEPTDETAKMLAKNEEQR